MYKLPPKDELLPLVGACLTKVCCTVGEVGLYFDRDCAVRIQGLFEFKATGKSVWMEPPSLGGEITGLLNQSVAAVEITEAATVLSLVFESGQTLLIPPDDHYEAIQLEIGERTFYV